MDNSIDIDLCKASMRIEIDYLQSAVKLFFDQPAKCGEDGKEFLIIFFYCLFLHASYEILCKRSLLSVAVDKNVHMYIFNVLLIHLEKKPEKNLTNV